MSGGDAHAGERLVLFEVGGSVYALPIADVREVSEPGPPAGVPTLPRRIVSVANHHGDALPVVARGALFEEGEQGFPEPAHVLVIGDRAARFGLPVDRVVGIVPGATGAGGGSGIVVERRELEGRVVGILDATRLFERAVRAIEQSGSAPAPEGGAR